MQYNPLVSIVIPFHNSESTLIRCLNSVISQTYRPLEVVLVNDASTDSSMTLVNKVISGNFNKNLHLKVLLFEENKGVAAARQAALEEAEGEYMYSIDSDDYVEEGAVSAMVEATENGTYDIVACGMVYEYPHKTRRATFPPGYELSLKTAVADTLHFSLQTKLLRTESLRKLNPFTPGHNYWEDLGAVARMLAAGAKAATLPEAYYHYVQTQASVTRNVQDHMRVPQQRIALTRDLEKWMKSEGHSDKYDDFLMLIKCVAKANILRPDAYLFRHPLKNLRLWRDTFPEVNVKIKNIRTLSTCKKLYLRGAYLISKLLH